MSKNALAEVPSTWERKWLTAGGSGRASSGCPTRKCPGVSASTPLSSDDRATTGLLFKHASTWVSWALQRTVWPQRWCDVGVSSCFNGSFPEPSQILFIVIVCAITFTAASVAQTPGPSTCRGRCGGLSGCRGLRTCQRCRCSAWS